MTHALIGRLALAAGRPPHRAVLVATALLALAGVARAQDPAQPLSAVHHQVVPAGLPGPLIAEVLIPPPPVTSWRSVVAASDSGCLSPLGVAPTAEGAALTLELSVRGTEGGLAAGESCAATVTIRFETSDETHEVVVHTVFHRPAAPAYDADDVRTGYAVDRVSLAPASLGLGRLLELSVSNDAQEPLVITGIVGLESLMTLGAQAYLLSESGPVDDLSALEILAPGTAVTVAPGGHQRIGLVVDLEASFGDAPWVASLQPALTIEKGSQPFTLRYPLVVTASGVELP